jgi:hypothetical protein
MVQVLVAGWQPQPAVTAEVTAVKVVIGIGGIWSDKA